jgi:hypothetical protein
VEKYEVFLLEGRMAQRRMFSKTITNSDPFLEMPLSSQNLYFHLGMNADDDGFVQAKSTMKKIGANEDDLKLLIAKGFLIKFFDGVIVITAWKINNEIRGDRYKPTYYAEHLKRLQLLENKCYSLPENILVLPNDNQLTPQVRLGKDRIDKIREEKKRPSPEEIQTYIDSRGKNYFTGQQFYDKNQTNGWLTGKHRDSIKDWKAVVRTWESWHESNIKEKRIKKPLQSFRNQNAFNDSLKDLNPKEFFYQIEKPKQLEDKT